MSAIDCGIYCIESNGPAQGRNQACRYHYQLALHERDALRADLARVTAERDAALNSDKHNWRAREYWRERTEKAEADLARARAALLSLPERDATEKLARAQELLAGLVKAAADNARAFLASGDVEKSRGIETAPPAPHPDNCRSPDCYDAGLCHLCGWSFAPEHLDEHIRSHARPAPPPVAAGFEWRCKACGREFNGGTICPGCGQDMGLPPAWTESAEGCIHADGCVMKDEVSRLVYRHAPDCPAARKAKVARLVKETVETHAATLKRLGDNDE